VLEAIGKYQANNTATTAQVKHRDLAFLWIKKISQQHRINGKSIALFMLPTYQLTLI
jgi:hypothetical protein